jgi:prepilin-type N-terminal cleavage/methylation domain-containing protein
MNQKGFTLVELIAIMIILGIMVVVAIPKFISMNRNAEKVGITSAIKDLNLREMESWANLKLENQYKSDEQLFANTDYQIEGYKWSSLNATGGLLQFKQTVAELKREASTMRQTASWSIQEN